MVRIRQNFPSYPAVWGCVVVVCGHVRVCPVQGLGCVGVCGSGFRIVAGAGNARCTRREHPYVPPVLPTVGAMNYPPPGCSKVSCNPLWGLAEVCWCWTPSLLGHTKKTSSLPPSMSSRAIDCGIQQSQRQGAIEREKKSEEARKRARESERDGQLSI